MDCFGDFGWRHKSISFTKWRHGSIIMRSRWRIWYLYINLAWTPQFSTKLLNRNCYRFSHVSWALAQISCQDSFTGTLCGKICSVDCWFDLEAMHLSFLPPNADKCAKRWKGELTLVSVMYSDGLPVNLLTVTFPGSKHLTFTNFWKLINEKNLISTSPTTNGYNYASDPQRIVLSLLQTAATSCWFLYEAKLEMCLLSVCHVTCC